MLKFHLRDSSNAKALVNLNRKSDSVSLKSKAKKAAVSKVSMEDTTLVLYQKTAFTIHLRNIRQQLTLLKDMCHF